MRVRGWDGKGRGGENGVLKMEYERSAEDGGEIRETKMW